jgi:hypothetical protein
MPPRFLLSQRTKRLKSAFGWKFDTPFIAGASIKEMVLGTSSIAEQSNGNLPNERTIRKLRKKESKMIYTVTLNPALDRFILLDADGSALHEALDYQPTCIKPNIYELSRLAERELQTESEILAFVSKSTAEELHISLSRGEKRVCCYLQPNKKSRLSHRRSR